MAIRNIILMEAVENANQPTAIAALIKKQMSTCKLTAFTSDDACQNFYLSFFLQSVPDNPNLSISDWSDIYTKLFSDQTFLDNLCYFIVAYQPAAYEAMFDSLEFIMKVERQDSKKAVRCTSEYLALMNMLSNKMAAVSEVLKYQVLDVDVIKFLTQIKTAIDSKILHASKELQALTRSVYANPEIDPASVTVIKEDFTEFLNLLENHDQWISSYLEKETLNEGIVNNVKERINELNVKRKKAERAFDELVMKKFREIQENRRNIKHAEMVGEALRINREMKRLLAAGAVSIVSPSIAVLGWIVSIIIDQKTDKRDRDILIGQIKDEIEIIDEKISQADRNNDDKAKVELMRMKQRYAREYERINRVRYDNSRGR